MAALNCILHPHHVSLSKHPFTFQSLFHSFEDRVDPYYGIDDLPSHKRLGCPRFNVSETEDAFILDGELPGVSDKKQISVEWLQNQVLIIRGIIKPADTENMQNPFKKGTQNDLVPTKGRCSALQVQPLPCDFGTKLGRA
jgi:HSP20 family molecular chaperone IbpA